MSTEKQQRVKLPAETRMGTVALVVRDLNRAIDYYTGRIGLQVLAQDEMGAKLGVEGRTLLQLVVQPDAKPVARGHTGLYHFALLLPSRAELGNCLRHLAATKTPVAGASDHAVSEALYLTDPDGHGIEIYRDRPRSEWPMQADGEVAMKVDPLDAEGILAAADADGAWAGMPPTTVMGHVHLHVADLAAAEAFYVDALGFDLMQRFAGQASFVSAGGYHHHLGMNIWAGRGAPPPPPDAARLRWCEIVLPDARSLDLALARLDETGFHAAQQNSGWLVRDPAHNGVILRA